MADPLYTPSNKNRLRFDRPQGLSDEQAQIGRDNLKVDAAMQAAWVAMWQEIYERTAAPSTAGVPWNRFGHVMVSSAGPTGVGSMAIGETFVVS